MTDKTRIQLSPDALGVNKINFNLELDNSINFYNALLFCSKVVLENKLKYFEDKYGYNVWKENHIISSIARTLKEEERKPEHLKEDLNVIIQRRDDMVDRIFSQVNYFNTNHHRIQETLQVQDVHFQQYNPLIFAIFPDSLILESIQSKGNYYVRYELHRSAMLFNDLPEMGCSFVEFNYQFYTELLSKINILKLPESNSMQIISSPWGEKDYMKRPTIALSRRRLTFDSKLIKLYIQAPLVEYLYNSQENEYVQELKLNKVETFDLFHIIENQYSKDETILVKIISAASVENTRYTSNDEMLTVEIFGESDRISFFKLHVNAIKNLQHLVHIIESVSISFIFEFLPIKLTLHLKEDRINIVQQFFTSRYDEQLFYILLSYHTFKYNKRLYNRILNYIQENQTVNDSEIQFSFKLNDEQLHSAICDLLFSGKVLLDEISN
ncbi:MAG: hypothetical protein ACW99A_16235, partial [Candidatus Kariarchaeaceae archaeon]